MDFPPSAIRPVFFDSYIICYPFACGSLIALMMEAVRTSETLVNINLTTGQYIPEDSKLQFPYDCKNDAENHFRLLFNTVTHTSIVSVSESFEHLYECCNIFNVICDVKQYKTDKDKL
jgi:hypothetical protein